MSLISCASSRELLDRHVLDSLALSPALPRSGFIADLGSGAGFPGLPLAIVNPDRNFVLVESRQRRASFLGEVRRTLQLKNVQIVEQRADLVPEGLWHEASAVTSRAVWSDADLLAIAEHWLCPGGFVLSMRSEGQEAGASFSGFECTRQLRYRIGAYPPRRVDVFTRATVSRETLSDL